jgi:hypothetical protein
VTGVIWGEWYIHNSKCVLKRAETSVLEAVGDSEASVALPSPPAGTFVYHKLECTVP